MLQKLETASRGVPIIGSAKISATDMANYYQYRYRYRTVGELGLPNMLKISPIILSRISQNFLLLFFFILLSILFFHNNAHLVSVAIVT